MLNVRKTIGTRLNQEMQRKGIPLHQLVSLSGQSSTVIESYLAGKREINFTELKAVCNVLVLDLMWLIGKNYETCHLHYRSSGPKDREIASKIENSFLLVKDYLPKVKRLPTTRIDYSQDDTNWLLAHVKSAVDKVRTQYSTVEEIIRAANIPVLPIRAGDSAFDAFLMASKNSAVICVNLDKPTVRIHFSLLHEVAHFLFDADRDVPVDVLPTGLYYDKIKDESKPEYIANKFAQFFLVPFEDAEKMAREFPRLAEIGDYIDSRRTGTDVLLNAIYDIQKLNGKNITYGAIKATIATATDGISWGGDVTLRSFLREQGSALRASIAANRDDFSDDIWKNIADAWDINDCSIF